MQLSNVNNYLYIATKSTLYQIEYDLDKKYLLLKNHIDVINNYRNIQTELSVFLDSKELLAYVKSYKVT